MTHQPEYQWEQTLPFRLDLYRLALAVDQSGSGDRDQADSLSALVRECVPVRDLRQIQDS